MHALCITPLCPHTFFTCINLQENNCRGSQSKRAFGENSKDFQELTWQLAFEPPPEFQLTLTSEIGEALDGFLFSFRLPSLEPYRRRYSTYLEIIMTWRGRYFQFLISTLLLFSIIINLNQSSTKKDAFLNFCEMRQIYRHPIPR